MGNHAVFPPVIRFTPLPNAVHASPIAPPIFFPRSTKKLPTALAPPPIPFPIALPVLTITSPTFLTPSVTFLTISAISILRTATLQTLLLLLHLSLHKMACCQALMARDGMLNTQTEKDHGRCLDEDDPCHNTDTVSKEQD